MANVVDIVIRARDAASRAFLGADRHIGRALSGIGRRAGAVLAPLARLAPALAAVGSAAITAAPFVAKGVLELYKVGQAAVQAAPALAAFAVAGGVVSGTLKAIFAEGRAMREVLQPLADGLALAGDNASRAAASGLKPFVSEFQKVAWPEINHTMVRIGTSVNRVAKSFLAWGKSAEGARVLDQVLHPIWQAVERLEAPLTRAGISFARMLGRIMGVSMEAGSSGLTGVLDRLSTAMDKVTGETVSAGLEKLKNTATTVGNAISTVVGWVKTLAGWYQVYQTQFGALADVLGVVAIAFGGPVTALIGAVGIIIRHWDDLKAAGQKVVDFFTKTPQGAGFIQNIKNAALEVWPHIQKAFKQIKESVIPVVQEIARKVKEEFIPAFGEFIRAVAPVVSWLVDTAGPWIARTFENIGKVVKGALDIIIGIIKVFTGILTGDWSKAWDGLVSILKGVWGVIWGILSQVVNNIRAIGGAIIDGLWAGIKAGWDLLLTLLEGIGKGFINFFKMIFGISSPSTVFLGIGKDIILGLLNGIKEMWLSVLGWLAGVGAAVLGFFANAVGWLAQKGRDIISGLLGGIQGAWGVATGWIGKIKDFITGHFPNPLSLLWNIGSAIINGLWNGLKSAWGAVSGWLGGIKNTIARIKGPIEADRKLLVPQGRAIMDGFYEGMESRLAGVKALAASVAGVVAGAPAWDTPAAGGGGAPGQGGRYYTGSAAPAGTATAGGGGRVVLELRSSGSRADNWLLEQLRGAIRVRGGDVQVVLGT